MEVFNFKKRLFFVFFDISLLLITFLSVYFGVNRLITYLLYPDVIVFSFFTVFSILFFLLTMPIIALSVNPIGKGRQANIVFQKNMAKTIILGLLFIIISTILFNVIFTNNLNKEGYIKCRGIPSGWMPGMAVKYALSEELCMKKAERHVVGR